MTDPAFRLSVGAGVGLWFVLVYAGADIAVGGWAGAVQGGLASLATPWDAAIPFWPGWALVYLSVTPFLCLPLVLVPDRAGMTALALTLAAMIALGGLVFVAFPVADPPLPPGPYPWVFRLADAVNLNDNNLPSLHVALTVATWAALRPHLGAWRGVVGLWAALICLSTLVTHQHDIASFSGGLALAALGHLALGPAFRRATTRV